MKVIATEYQEQRVVIDNVNAITAAMTVDVLNQAAAGLAVEAKKRPAYYHYERDDYEVKRAS